MFRHIITLLICCCISLSLNAQTITVKNNHPERYTVKQGDTLWDISAKFLRDPWQWPAIWNLNKSEIKNPHLIYPGDVIVFDTVDGKPTLRLLRETVLGHGSIGSHTTTSTPGNTVNLEPSVEIEPLNKVAISTIRLSSIMPFLNQPLIIEKDQLNSAPRIIAGQDDRVILSPATRIYVRGIPDSADLDWHIYRQGELLVDPETKTHLGYEAIYLGDAKLTQYGDPATAKITKAKEEIFAKDRLIAINNNVQTNFMPHAPEHAIQGRIINIYSGVSEAGQGSIVSINRGTENGVEVGHVLAIKHLGRMINDGSIEADMSFSLKNIFSSDKKTQKRATNMVKLPDERAGLMMIFRTFKNVSYGLIMQTEQSVNQFDAVANP